MSPMDSASSALMCRPVSSSSAATVYGTCRGSRTAEPPSGNSPQRASETPNRALAPATLMSHACRISVPPAIAGPSTAAISGLLSRRPLSSGSITETSSSPSRAPGWSRVIALRSAPAQNAPPAPVSTQTRMPGSPSTVSQACRISSIIGPLSALRTAGRFIVTISTCPRRSMSACGSSAGSPPGWPAPVAVMWRFPSFQAFRRLAQNSNTFYFRSHGPELRRSLRACRGRLRRTHRGGLRRPAGDLPRAGGTSQPAGSSPGRPRGRSRRSRRPLRPQLGRGDRDAARGVQAARRRRQHQLPLRRERVAVHARGLGPGRAGVRPAAGPGRGQGSPGRARPARPGGDRRRHPARRGRPGRRQRHGLRHRARRRVAGPRLPGPQRRRRVHHLHRRHHRLPEGRDVAPRGHLAHPGRRHRLRHRRTPARRVGAVPQGPRQR